MIIAIVGPEASKWTKEGEESARRIIQAYLMTGKYAGVVSGECHLGGVDIWAREETAKRGVYFRGYPAAEQRWDGPRGYRQRNQAMARVADEVICIAPIMLPSGRAGWCKHCREAHVCSGGCWTVQYAEKIGRKVDVVEITV